jgi:hypothetical protein
VLIPAKEHFAIRSESENVRIAALGTGTKPAKQARMSALRSNVVLGTLMIGILTACAQAESAGADEQEVRTGKKDGGADSGTPVDANSETNAVRLSAAENHTCAIRSGGALFCWGTNTNGQLGDGTTTDAPQPVRVGGNDTWSAVATAETHSCGIKTDGTLWCWGGSSRLAPAKIGATSDWQDVSVSLEKSCALKTDGSLWCWDENQAGGPNPTRFGTGDWSRISVAAQHTCGVSTSGELWCWGTSNSFNQLGVRNASTDGTPVRVDSAVWEDVSTGGNNLYGYSCGRRRDKTLWCWGYATASRHGRGSTDSSTAIGKVNSSRWASAVTGRPIGGSYVAHTCAVREDGVLHCWGWNSDGQVGPSTDHVVHRPAAVSTDTDWTGVAVGDSHTCGARRDGSIYCWGSNASGQLGVAGAGGSTLKKVTFPGG